MGVVRGDRIITTLDVGTSKVAALVAELGVEGEARLLGFGQRACAGVRRGLVADMEKTEAAIRAAVDQAERQAGIQADKVVVSLAAGGLDSAVASVETEVGGRSIERRHVDEVLGEARRHISAGSRTILHAQPALYVLDGATGVRNPLGFYAERLGVDVHVITADTPPIRNLDLCVRNAHLGVQTIVASSAAAGIACLAPEERDLGVALVEIGAGVTNVAVHVSGMLVGIATIPMGGQDITDDIANAFATRRVHAERLKTLHGAAVATPKDNHDLIEIQPIVDDDGTEPGRAPRAQLIAVIRQRLDMLFAEVAEQLRVMGYTGPSARQVVLTGGGSDLRSIQDYAQAALGRPVRLGRPRGLKGLTDAARGVAAGPAFSTVVGLALFAAEDPADILNMQPQPAPSAERHRPQSSFARMASLLRASL